MKKKKGAVDVPKGPGLVEGLFDMLGTNTDTLESRSRSVRILHENIFVLCFEERGKEAFLYMYNFYAI